MRIGIVGHYGQAFDYAQAESMIKEAFSGYLGERHNVEVVSGLTNVGIPAIAYRLAAEYGFKTIGIACKKAEKYDCFPCDRVEIVGENWGDESETFLKSIDVLMRFGGDPQSMAECARAKEMGLEVIEFELVALPK